jgi:hypothetical protein
VYVRPESTVSKYAPSWIEANDSSVAPKSQLSHSISSCPNILPDSVSSDRIRAGEGWWRLVEAGAGLCTVQATISEIPVPRSIDAQFPVSGSKSAVTNSPRGYDIARGETRGLRQWACQGLPGMTAYFRVKSLTQALSGVD